MKVVFPIKLDGWQSFLYYHGSVVLCVLFAILIINLIIGCVFSDDKVSKHVNLPFGFGAGLALSMLISIACIFVIGASGQIVMPYIVKYGEPCQSLMLYFDWSALRTTMRRDAVDKAVKKMLIR